MRLCPRQLEFVARLVQERAAIVLPPGKEYLVQDRLGRLAGETGHGSASSLVGAVQAGLAPQWRDRIVEALTINETWWFRDLEPFTALAEVIVPDLAGGARPAGAPVRVWSAACASGQEPYSVAMLLAERLAGWPGFQVVASDLSAGMVARARAGRYSQSEIDRGLPAGYLGSYFERAGQDWQVSERLRRHVSFRQLNLAAELPALPAFDVVLLRNVLIYFDSPTRQRVLNRVRRVLRPGGWLLLGAAETTVGLDGSYQRVPFGRTTVFRLPPLPDPMGAQC